MGIPSRDSEPRLIRTPRFWVWSIEAAPREVGGSERRSVRYHRPLKLPERNRLAAGKRAILASIAAWSGKPVGLSGRHPRAQGPSSLATKLCSVLDRVANTQGIERSLRMLADASSACRVAWLESKAVKKVLGVAIPQSDSFIEQFSYVKRALPVAPQRVVDEAILKHRSALLDEWVTEEDLVADFREFTERWALSHLPKDPDPSELLALSESACFEKKVREGGLASYTRELLDTAPEIEAVQPPGVLSQEWYDCLADERIYRAASAMSELQPFPSGRVAVVREFGLKARIVTTSSGYAIILGHAARRRLFKGLHRCKETAGSLGSDEVATVRALLRGASGSVLSSDLTSATDLLPLDLVAGGVEGLHRSGRFLAHEISGLRACTGPQKVCWPSISSEFEITKRGILMGQPTSWALLSLVHLWWIERARASLPIPRSPTDKWHLRAAICGDDAVLLGTDSTLDEYESLLKRCGAKLSEGKHARSGLGRAVFLEKLLFFKETGRRPLILDTGTYAERIEHLPCWGDVVFSDSLTLAGLVAPAGGFFVGALCAVAPDSETNLAAGAVVETLVEGKWSVPKVFAVQQTLYTKAMADVRKQGIPPCLPRRLGGAGFITRKGYDVNIRRVASAKHRKAVAVLLNRGTVTPGPGVFARQWRRATSGRVYGMAEEDAEGLLSRVRCHVGADYPVKHQSEGPWYACGSHDDFVEQQTNLAHRRLLSLLPPGCIPMAKVGLGELGRRTRSTVNKLIKLWPGSKSLRALSVGECVRRHQLLVDATTVWLPGTEDPRSPWLPKGVPWMAGEAFRSKVRGAALHAMTTDRYVRATSTQRLGAPPHRGEYGSFTEPTP
jgi:hypothetical protein